eukprot:TRINITY_DN29939_c0_g1_i1.p1 TRINITY_DN29939_c0_g1~~TRINITY_DN29939_c0_g1_i1.p1  ORF type:complete len:581 (-),score=128.79 TRINITY_DN29939_c0_g1_i1:200-1819(-)
MKYLEAHWDFVSDNVAKISSKAAYESISNHVLLIGLASLLLLSCMVYNLCTSILTLRANWRHWSRQSEVADEDGAMPKYKKLQKSTSEKSKRGGGRSENEEEDDKDTKGRNSKPRVKKIEEEEEDSEEEDSDGETDTEDESEESSSDGWGRAKRRAEKDEPSWYKGKAAAALSKKGRSTHGVEVREPKAKTVARSMKMTNGEGFSKGDIVEEWVPTRSGKDEQSRLTTNGEAMGEASKGAKSALMLAIERAQEKWHKEVRTLSWLKPKTGVMNDAGKSEAANGGDANGKQAQRRRGEESDSEAYDDIELGVQTHGAYEKKRQYDRSGRVVEMSTNGDRGDRSVERQRGDGRGSNPQIAVLGEMENGSRAERRGDMAAMFERARSTLSELKKEEDNMDEKEARDRMKETRGRLARVRGDLSRTPVEKASVVQVAPREDVKSSPRKVDSTKETMNSRLQKVTVNGRDDNGVHREGDDVEDIQLEESSEDERATIPAWERNGKAKVDGGDTGGGSLVKKHFVKEKKIFFEKQMAYSDGEGLR